jgi:hypothetical protein
VTVYGPSVRWRWTDEAWERELRRRFEARLQLMRSQAQRTSDPVEAAVLAGSLRFLEDFVAGGQPSGQLPVPVPPHEQYATHWMRGWQETQRGFLLSMEQNRSRPPHPAAMVGKMVGRSGRLFRRR